MTLNGPLPQLLELASKYDGILSDVWGVVHNGIKPYESAVKALSDFRAGGGHVVLITNASRPGHVIEKMLDDMGVSRDTYDAIVSSGDVTRTFIAKYRGEKIHHVGPETDHPIYDGLDVTMAPANEAKVVVVTGTMKPEDTPDDYDAQMTEWLDLGLTMICTNPDKVVEIGTEIRYCAGALADVYAERGGKVEIAGKPYAPIYDASIEALEKAANRDIQRARVLAIGDSTRTDAKGAADAGLDLLFITGSIHAEELGAFDDPDPKKISELLAPTGARVAGYQLRLT